jgi:hypothetical protein
MLSKVEEKLHVFVGAVYLVFMLGSLGHYLAPELRADPVQSTIAIVGGLIFGAAYVRFMTIRCVRR